MIPSLHMAWRHVLFANWHYPVWGVVGATTTLGLGLLVTMLTVAVGALVVAFGVSLGAGRPVR
ncbi:hypothetical protein [Halobaculum rarum]|uniref:hypothetical protein n=1 Tax=Halobaculum rarum TaxID=3075122 RepID=UPI0032AF0579